jgi:hypothetical protein
VAKKSGLGQNLYVDGFNVSGDALSWELSHENELLETTGIDKSAYERTLGLRGGTANVTSWFNDATGQQFDAFKTPVAANGKLITVTTGTTLGDAAFAGIAHQGTFAGNRGDDGTFTFEVEASVRNGVPFEWGVQGTAGVRTDTAATNGTGIDHGASTSFGLAAYLQVFSFTGTSCTVTIQESSDDAATDAYAAVTGGAFTAATGRTTQRIQTATNQTVERYLRVVTTGTFSSCAFHVTIVRYIDVAPLWS